MNATNMHCANSIQTGSCCKTLHMSCWPDQLHAIASCSSCLRLFMRLAITYSQRANTSKPPAAAPVSLVSCCAVMQQLHGMSRLNTDMFPAAQLSAAYTCSALQSSGLRLLVLHCFYLKRASRQASACDADSHITQRACTVSVRAFRAVCVGKYLAIRRLLSVQVLPAPQVIRSPQCYRITFRVMVLLSVVGDHRCLAWLTSRTVPLPSVHRKLVRVDAGPAAVVNDQQLWCEAAQQEELRAVALHHLTAKAC